ncbi:FecR domain-containing protein [Pseudomonas gingeri]|uniref:FecR family protein n=1 Tax=Pseudomonas gingeri TaxID=117681 RepID=A0A7Y7YGZ0_9PSED|nr:FecR family protein [Pseudomonas gingeri]NWA01634.1 FecR family protein [Pseudomonas gingeri]NWA13563.1 FecR family protein [Pseudomonas gingeri]NWA53077.1 FecR family protein [Pseudomonas gingeri]NWA96574.1 FecR family protein [Pseudomonas gingeri]NWA99789.1 FecR family protein [Pseudomonas gingeri]
MSREQDPDPLIEEAARWIVRLRSGQASDADRRAYQQWRNQDPRHEQLCNQLENRLGVFRTPIDQGISGELLQRALSAPASRRKLLQGALLGVGVMLGAGLLLGDAGTSLAELTADLRTGTAERRSLELPDGSELQLNARSAADIDFDPRRRQVRLLDGELLARVARDTARPFVVQAPQARVHAYGDHLLVRERDGQGHVVALGGAVEIVGPTGERLQLPAGHEVSYDRYRFGPIRLSHGSATAWVDGLLEVRDGTLGEVVEALRPWRPGVLRLDPAIASLRVSGLFRLDRPEQILDTLARTLPIRVARHTDLWVTLSPA